MAAAVVEIVVKMPFAPECHPDLIIYSNSELLTYNIKTEMYGFVYANTSEPETFVKLQDFYPISKEKITKYFEADECCDCNYSFKF